MTLLEKIAYKLKIMKERSDLGEDVQTIHYAPENALLIPITLKNGRTTFKQS